MNELLLKQLIFIFVVMKYYFLPLFLFLGNYGPSFGQFQEEYRQTQSISPGCKQIHRINQLHIKGIVFPFKYFHSFQKYR